ncbi:hypothetical protein [Halocatena salina]|uniref:hypothetical protein n=1 Tax=Halocatena salina TaxID=2934340 RepID=UPI003F61089B
MLDPMGTADVRTLINELAGETTLAIKDEFEDYYETEIHAGRLYPNLDTVDKGLVEKGQLDRRTITFARLRCHRSLSNGDRRIQVGLKSGWVSS